MNGLPILYCSECDIILEEGRSGQCDDCLDDEGLTAEQLDCKYNPEGDGEHHTYTRWEWRQAVASQSTIAGYWPWVEYQISQGAA